MPTNCRSSPRMSGWSGHLAVALMATALLPVAVEAQISGTRTIADPTRRTTLTAMPQLAPAHSVKVSTSPTRITLKWSCVDGPTGYDVYVTPTGGATTKLTNAPLGPCLQDLELARNNDPRLASTSTSYVSSFSHTGLTPNQELTYFVRAIYPSGVADTPALTVRSLWPAPTGLRMTVGYDFITLNWNPVSGASGYVVYRKTVWDSDFRPLNPTPLATATHTDLWYAMPASYYVKAVDGAGSEVVNFHPPAP